MAMPAPAARTDWTAEEINTLPDDGNRYEVVDGELLVSPAPTNEHQEAVVELLVRMRAYVIAASMQILVAPSAVRFSSRREVQPDLLVLPLVDGKRARSFREVGRLELAVEILSPSTARPIVVKSADSINRSGCRSTGSSTSRRGWSSGGGLPIRRPTCSSNRCRGYRATMWHRW